MSAALHAQTPTLTATDSRGLVVRSVQWYRADSSHEPESRVTQMRQDLLGREVENRDPRLFACAAPRPNLATIYSLSGLPLFSDSVDSGWQATLMTEDGLPVVRQDGRGTQTDYEYDELRRLTAVFETADGQARCAERFGYGGVEADHEHNLRQRLLRRDDPAGARHMLAYDLNGLTQQERQHFIEGLEAPDWPESETARDALLEDSDNYTSQWTFSPWGDQLQMIDAAGNCHRQQFSVAGRLAASSLHAAKNGTVVTLVDQISYTPLDQVQRQVAGNGLVTETTYDPADNRLMRLQCGSLQDLTYLYDPVGNVVCHEDHSVEDRYLGNRLVEPVAGFRYDSLYQLIEATGRERVGAGRGPDLAQSIDFASNDSSLIGAYTRRYQYDAGGNLSFMQHQGQNGNEHTLQMAVSSTSNQSIPWREGLDDRQIEENFDANGNLNQVQPGTNTRWDLRNQLAEVLIVQRAESQNDTERYTYGGGGKRLRKHSTKMASSITHHSETRYLPGLELHDDTATGQRWQVVYVNAGRSTIRLMHWDSEPPAEMKNDGIFYGFDNLLGSITLETDEQALLVSREEYYPFGGTALVTASSEVEVSYKTLRYSGKERDATGLYYYGYRYLAPWLCRWLNPDPAGIIDGLNVFGFVGNNPVTWSDSDGLAKDDDTYQYLLSQLIEITNHPPTDSPEPSPGSNQQIYNSLVSELLGITQKTGADIPSTSPVPGPSSAVQPAVSVANETPPIRTPKKSRATVPKPRVVPPAVPSTSQQAKVSSKSTLKRHACTFEGCGKNFATSTNLNRHFKLHTGKDLSKCTHPGCNHVSPNPSHLKAHLQVHSDEPSYKCNWPGCVNAYKQLNNLVQHRNAHKGVSFACKVCSKSFVYRSSLNSHIRKRHPDHH